MWVCGCVCACVYVYVVRARVCGCCMGLCVCVRCVCARARMFVHVRVFDLTRVRRWCSSAGGRLRAGVRVCAHAVCWAAAVVVVTVCSWGAQCVCMYVFVCPSRLAFVYEWCAWVAVRLDRQRLCAVGCVSVSVGSCEHLRWCVCARV